MKTILIIEDEWPIMEMLMLVLQDEGYGVIFARNGQEGLLKLSEVTPDMVICDVMMPIMDGRDFCRQMQTNPDYKDIPIVMMSAVNTLANKSMECRWTRFLQKPFDLDTLLNCVGDVIGAP